MAWQDVAIAGTVSAIAAGLGAGEFAGNVGTLTLLYPGPDKPWHDITYGVMSAGALSGGGLGVGLLLGHALNIHSMDDFARVSPAAFNGGYPKFLLLAMFAVAGLQGWTAYEREGAFQKDAELRLYSEKPPQETHEKAQTVAGSPVGYKQIQAAGEVDEALQQGQFAQDDKEHKGDIAEFHRSQKMRSDVIKRRIPGEKQFRVTFAVVLSAVEEILAAAIPAFFYALLSIPAGGRHAPKRKVAPIEHVAPEEPTPPKSKRSRWSLPWWLTPGNSVGEDPLPSMAREIAID